MLRVESASPKRFLCNAIRLLICKHFSTRSGQGHGRCGSWGMAADVHSGEKNLLRTSIRAQVSIQRTSPHPQPERWEGVRVVGKTREIRLAGIVPSPYTYSFRTALCQ